MFYEAEACAFLPQVVLKAFADVGLNHWDPDIIVENARGYCPVASVEDESTRVQDLLEKNKRLEEEKRAELDRMTSEMEPAEVVSVKKGGRRRTQRKKVTPAPKKSAQKRPRSNVKNRTDDGGEGTGKRWYKVWG